MALRTYEIIFEGEAVPAIVAAFEDFQITVGCGTTTMRREFMDQPALHGGLQRVQALGLDLLGVTTV